MQGAMGRLIDDRPWEVPEHNCSNNLHHLHWRGRQWGGVGDGGRGVKCWMGWEGV